MQTGEQTNKQTRTLKDRHTERKDRLKRIIGTCNKGEQINKPAKTNAISITGFSGPHFLKHEQVEIIQYSHEKSYNKRVWG